MKTREQIAERLSIIETSLKKGLNHLDGIQRERVINSLKTETEILKNFLDNPHDVSADLKDVLNKRKTLLLKARQLPDKGMSVNLELSNLTTKEAVYNWLLK